MMWLKGGSIFDTARGRFEPRDISIVGGRIAAITADGRPGAGDEIVDVAGLHLLPGLIDCHVHLAMPTDEADPSVVARWPDALVAIHALKAAERTLLGGTTSVRDCGGWNHVEMAVRRAVEKGWAAGPRMFLAGRLLSITTGGVNYYPGMYEVANGPEEVRAAARRQLAAGADFIKVMATGAMLSPENEDARAIQFTRAELAAAVEIARDNYKPVAAHAHAHQGIVNAVEAGVDSIEHGTFADDHALKLMAEKGVHLVPTCCAFTALALDPQVTAAMPEHLRARLANHRETHTAAVRRAYELGVPIAMGTDAGTPGNHHGANADECVAMVEEVGMPPADSIRAATINAARLLREDSRLGSLEPGKHADVIATFANPLDDIRALKRLALVIKDGTIHRHETLANR